ncbi:molybdenum cofactor guanylyltransferase [Bacillus sp. 179-C3.3 HS]|uniref:molybdenum cofactor guanylyltransferase n=1 Tax=Bacillus sp. 179-C3.3 HS TaxID=3232162 RepID=UPI0039A1E1DC
MNIIHVILAGGASRRFGEPKASYTYKGKPLYVHVKEQMVGDQVMIISHPSLISFFQARGEQDVWLDDEHVRGRGPLAGIYTAMQKKQADWYLVTACDMPFIRKETAQMLVTYCSPQVDAVVPQIEGRLQPLFALYHRRSLLFMKECLEENQLAMINLLQKLQVHIVSEEELDVSPNEFHNINRRSDLLENDMI